MNTCTIVIKSKCIYNILFVQCVHLLGGVIKFHLKILFIVSRSA